MTIIGALDLAAVLVFALTGALAASRSQLDIVGFIFVACLTAVGGGTLRDLMLGRDPVFWVSAPHYILIAAGAAIVVFFTAHLLESRYRTLLWLDAFALPVAVSAGVGVALSVGALPVIVVTMGVVTGCFGGLMRDVVCNEVPLILKQGELYATAAFAGALSGWGAMWFGLAEGWALLVAGGVTFLLRAGSLALGWRLNAYKPRPPKTRP
ncbi:trimeric intracellular cation channel family protein [Actibacterium sp. XHP0104]|uniref:trimeric intracellular cation channel family protein n=1 Tax=Actibacterium sp. XHP0104 TaxID=2984335 RepID=UPI0021E78BBA|nr:trimeric intracellular cation channel family protein [Actibacterium sp. XHP0104]MCV2881620.1 trimeric intracellular cation channel family protein [Actibacterium sp. XHP0104]